MKPLKNAVNPEKSFGRFNRASGEREREREEIVSELL